MRLAVATNQDGVMRGELSRDTAEALIVEILRKAIGCLPVGTVIEMCCCPLDPPCACRKPAPGLLLRALARTGVPAERALFVGDLASDEAAARAARVPFMWAWEFFR